MRFYIFILLLFLCVRSYNQTAITISSTPSTLLMINTIEQNALDSANISWLDVDSIEVIWITATDSVHTKYVAADDSIMTHKIRTDTIYYKMPHTRMVYNDSAVVISGGTNVQVTNASDSLWNASEITGFTYLKGDTIQFIYGGGYNIFFTIRGYGTNAVDWHVNFARKRGVTTTYGNQEVAFTTTGANNKNGGSAAFYGEFLPGDKIWMVLTRDSGSGDFTTTNSIWNTQLLYRE